MGTVPVLKPREVAALLLALGFQEVRQRGSHRQYRHPDGRGTTVPFHSGRDKGAVKRSSFLWIDDRKAGRHEPTPEITMPDSAPSYSTASLGILMLPADIERYIGKVFAPDEQATALEMVGQAKRHDGLAAEPRLLRCALVASDGTLKGLKYQLDGLAYDYRDVVLAAEYVRTKGDWVQIRDLSQPFADDA